MWLTHHTTFFQSKDMPNPYHSLFCIASELKIISTLLKYFLKETEKHVTDYIFMTCKMYVYYMAPCKKKVSQPRLWPSGSQPVAVLRITRAAC